MAGLYSGWLSRLAGYALNWRGKSKFEGRKVRLQPWGCLAAARLSNCLPQRLWNKAFQPTTSDTVPVDTFLIANWTFWWTKVENMAALNLSHHTTMCTNCPGTSKEQALHDWDGKQKGPYLTGPSGTLTIAWSSQALMSGRINPEGAKGHPNPRLSDKKSDSRQVMQSQTCRGHEPVGKSGAGPKTIMIIWQ